MNVLNSVTCLSKGLIVSMATTYFGGKLLSSYTRRALQLEPARWDLDLGVAAVGANAIVAFITEDQVVAPHIDPCLRIFPLSMAVNSAIGSFHGATLTYRQANVSRRVIITISSASFALSTAFGYYLGQYIPSALIAPIAGYALSQMLSIQMTNLGVKAYSLLSHG